MRERFISVVIPNHNGAATIAQCLTAALSCDYRRFEVVVVDDGSDDASVAIIRGFPCRLVRLPRRVGVSKARNAGAAASRGELLVFIDSDCLLGTGALSVANASYGERADRVLGGTYTPEPYDRDFFSAFQSVFVHHFETKRRQPDYVAAHAMVISAALFRRSGGFVEGSFIGVAASVEDVEFSHRLRSAGCELAMSPALEVQHIFRFSLRRSIANAIKKSRYWTMYSLVHGDLLADSGAASTELKANVVLALAQAVLLACALASGVAWLLAPAGLAVAANVATSRGLIRAWCRARGLPFALVATSYYMSIFAAAVAVGGSLGAIQYLWSARALQRCRA